MMLNVLLTAETMTIREVVGHINSRNHLEVPDMLKDKEVNSLIPTLEVTKGLKVVQTDKVSHRIANNPIINHLRADHSRIKGVLLQVKALGHRNNRVQVSVEAEFNSVKTEYE